VQLRRLPILFALALLPACDGCRPNAGGEGPARFIPAEDDILLTGSARVGVDLFSDWRSLWDTILSDAQLVQARAELERAFGFDPTDAEALEQAGFDPQGRWAAGFSAERDHWIVALPASNVSALIATVTEYGQKRFGAEPRTEDGVTRLVASFGPESVERAAILSRGNVVLVVVGARAAEVAATLKPLSASESAAALDDEGRATAVRGRFDIDGPALAAFARRSGLRDAERLAGVAGAWATRMDFSARFSPDGLELDNELILTDEGRAALGRATLEPAPHLAAVRAVAVPDAIIDIVGGIDPNFVFETLLPEGSEGRKAIDEARASGQLAIDLEREVVPALSGTFSASMGAGDLSDFEFRELVGATQKALWTSFAVGRNPGVEASPFQLLLESARKANVLSIETRTLSDAEIVRFRAAGTLISEAVETEHAWFGSNEPVVMNQILTRGPPDDAAPSLLEVEVRFPELHRALSTFQAGSLPLFVRATWAQILDAIDRLGALELEVHAEGQRLELDLGLGLEPPSAASEAEGGDERP